MLVIIVFSSVSIWQLFSKFSACWNYLLYAAIVYMIGAWIRLYADRIRASHPYLKITGVIVSSALLLFLFSVEIVSNGAIADWFNWSGHTMYGGVPVLPMIIAACIFYVVLQLPVRTGGPGPMRVSSLIARQNVWGVPVAWKSDLFCGVLVCGESMHSMGGRSCDDGDSRGCHSGAVRCSDAAVRDYQCCFGDSDHRIDYAFFGCTSCVSCH